MIQPDNQSMRGLISLLLVVTSAAPLAAQNRASFPVVETTIDRILRGRGHRSRRPGAQAASTS